MDGTRHCQVSQECRLLSGRDNRFRLQCEANHGFKRLAAAHPSSQIHGSRRGSVSGLWWPRPVAAIGLIDCHARQLLGWQLSRSAKFKAAEAALEQALIARFGSLGRVRTPFRRELDLAA